MSTHSPFMSLAISLGLGLLVGLQRERSLSNLAGIRTFPLVTILGTLSAMLVEPLGGGGWFPAAGFLAVLGAILVGNRVRPAGDTPSGITTEVALLVMYAVGVQTAFGPISVAVAVTGAVTILLHAKDTLHNFVHSLGDKDVRAIMQFALIALVILPVLPDESFGPYGVLNPRNVWLVVVLVVGMSLAGYVAYRLLGARGGAIVGGLLGGLVSSTATTVSYSKRAAESPAYVWPATLVIVLATAVVYGRVLAEISAVAPQLIWRIAPPILAMAGVAVVSALAALWLARGKDAEVPPAKNPSQLRAALFFAGMYSVVLIAVAAAKQHFGNAGLYVVAAISGLTDMDAITLSTARMANQGEVAPTFAGKVIIVAAMANLIFKAGITASLGGLRLFKVVALFFSFQIAAGIVLLMIAPIGPAAEPNANPDAAPPPAALTPSDHSPNRD